MSGSVAPTDEGAIATVIAEAGRRAEPLAVVGNATKAAMLRPVQAAHVLSVRNYAGITLYSPKELVLSARAGTTLPELEQALAEQGQHFIAEPPDLSVLLGAEGAQTLGGVVAANLSGPRRIAWGAMRDHVLGVRAVNGEGVVIRSGGRVLKNVTGLDLCKLLAGSHGTLGVMTEITLKVLPAPERVGTVVLPRIEPADAVRILAQAMGSRYAVSGAAFLPPDAAARVPELAGIGASVALARIEDFAASVSYRCARLLDEIGWGEIMDDAPSRAIWRAVRDAVPLPAEPSDAIWRISVRPSMGGGILRALADEVGARGFLDWAGGLVWIAASAEGETHAAIERAARAAGGVWTLLRAPDSLRSAVDVIPPEPPVLARITRQVKAALDPREILNPGRMYAGV
ncbi:MAG: FAD-binding protein [Acetobacteraceae bacterium]|nr:FAD-binding protein [Acetobacteraceae bacterium]